MKQSINSISDVVNFQLCVGCGICASIEPSRFEMLDIPTIGLRPQVCENPSVETGKSLEYCPGIALIHDEKTDDTNIIGELLPAWGPILEVWEGYASDPDTRSAGSSGGIATALATYIIEHMAFSGILHTAAKENSPWLNETVLSRSVKDLKKTSGSRYSPASPCDGLGLLEDEKQYAFIGKPCDIAALRGAMRDDTSLEKKVNFLIAFFCAGTPSTQGTVDLLTKSGVTQTDKVKSLRYRGNGWPGNWYVKYEKSDGRLEESKTSYEESWGFLQKYRQWRCYICPDHTGEFSDIAVGDPWYREIEDGELGKSLILVRTEKGRELLYGAVAAGYIHLEKNDPAILTASQPNLLTARGTLWARLNVLKMLLIPTPHYKGFMLFKFWIEELTLKQKVQSIFGTIKRAHKKKLRFPLNLPHSQDRSEQ